MHHSHSGHLLQQSRDDVLGGAFKSGFATPAQVGCRRVYNSIVPAESELALDAVRQTTTPTVSTQAGRYDSAVLSTHA